MSGVLERTLAILERLAADIRGTPLAALADELGIPRSAAHRLLNELTEHGYVRQLRERGDYVLTTKLVSLGLNYLKASGVVDLCQPLLDGLAERCGELVRLGVVDVDHVTWVALSQGARRGLRYDPDTGTDVRLSCSAAGHAWLATLAGDDAVALLRRQGIARPEDAGPNAPASIEATMRAVAQARRQGYAVASDSYAPGLSAVCCTIRPAGAGAVGVLAISGPSVRLTQARMHELAPTLRATADEIAHLAAASPLLQRAHAPAVRSVASAGSPASAPSAASTPPKASVRLAGTAGSERPRRATRRRGTPAA